VSRNLCQYIPALIYMLIPLALEGIAVSQERIKLVDTGVIFSGEQVAQFAEIPYMFELTPPFWTPTEEEVAHLEGKLRPYLEGVTIADARAIAAELGSYKRQYLGYTDGGKKWILVNGFCERHWRGDDSWHDSVVFVFDGGRCLFHVRYDLSRSQFEQLEINKDS